MCYLLTKLRSSSNCQSLENMLKHRRHIYSNIKYFSDLNILKHLTSRKVKLR